MARGTRKRKSKKQLEAEYDDEPIDNTVFQQEHDQIQREYEELNREYDQTDEIDDPYEFPMPDTTNNKKSKSIQHDTIDNSVEDIDNIDTNVDGAVDDVADDIIAIDDTYEPASTRKRTNTKKSTNKRTTSTKQRDKANNKTSMFDLDQYDTYDAPVTDGTMFNDTYGNDDDDMALDDFEKALARAKSTITKKQKKQKLMNLIQTSAKAQDTLIIAAFKKYQAETRQDRAQATQEYEQVLKDMQHWTDELMKHTQNTMKLLNAVPTQFNKLAKSAARVVTQDDSSDKTTELINDVRDKSQQITKGVMGKVNELFDTPSALNSNLLQSFMGLVEM